MPVGVVAIQGDFEKHLQAIHALGSEALEVRSPEDLDKVDRLIIPGGESTTVGLLMQRFGLGVAIQERAQAGMPIWGTCMGMILMSSAIENQPRQFRLNLLDISVERNAFGAQVYSFEDEIEIQGLDHPILGVFIRAPIVTRCGESVQAIGRYQGKVVAVRSGNLLGTSFHPELTDDHRFHELFVSIT